MAPSKPKRNNSKATSAGPTSARTYRRQPRENQVEPQDETTQSEPQPQAEVKFKREEDDDGYDDDTVAASFETNKPRPPAVISTRQHDFSERSWWMVDVDGPTDESPTQGATALVKRCMCAYGWDLPKTRKILNAYKQFLTLKKKLEDWDATLLSPCLLVDQMWHQHILDNFNYYHDMILLCGHFFGHNPDGALSLQAKVVRDQTTRDCLREHFGGYDAAIWDHVGGDEGMSNDAANANDEDGGDNEMDQGDEDDEGSVVNADHGADESQIDDDVARAGDVEVANGRFNPNRVTIEFKGAKRGDAHFIRVLRTAPMWRVFHQYAGIQGVSATAFGFLLHGDIIDDIATPQQLRLKNNDQIDVYRVQVRINLIVKDQTGEEMCITMKQTTQMSKMKNFYAKRKGVPASSFKLLLNGERIDLSATPIMLELEDDDEIDCNMIQAGC